VQCEIDFNACTTNVTVLGAKLRQCQAELASCREQNAPPAPAPPWWKFAWRHSDGDNPDQLEDMRQLNAKTFNLLESWRTYTKQFILPPLAWQKGRGAELRTGDWKMDSNPDMWHWAWLEIERIVAAQKAGHVAWVLLDAEVGWTERSEFMLELLRRNLPDLKVYSGPMSWSGPVPERFAKLDGCLSFWNPGSPNGRYKGYMAEDAALQLARNLGAIEFMGKPDFDFATFPQPVEGSPPYLPNLAEEYRRALEIACSVSPEFNNIGVGMWGARRLFEQYLDDTVIPFAAAEIIGYYQRAKPIDISARPRVYIPQQLHDNGMPDERLDKALARIVWHGGGLPVVAFRLTASGDERWSILKHPSWIGNPEEDILTIERPAVGRTEKLKQYGYEGEFAVFHDSGNPNRQGLDSHVLRCAVRDAEIEMGAQVRAWLEG